MKTHLTIWLLFSFVYLLFDGCSDKKCEINNEATIPIISKYTIEELDTLKLRNINSEHLISLLKQASILSEDTTCLESRTKSQIIYGIISVYLRDEFSAGNFSLEDKNMNLIIDVLESKKYYLNLNPPSDFDKVIHYLKRKRYDYIWSRFVGRGYHYYLIVLVLLIPFLIYVVIRKFNKKGELL